VSKLVKAVQLMRKVPRGKGNDTYRRVSKDGAEKRFLYFDREWLRSLQEEIRKLHSRDWWAEADRVKLKDC
jgi:hypothetical protein